MARRFVSRPTSTRTNPSHARTVRRVPNWLLPVSLCAVVIAGVLFFIDYRLRPMVVATSSALAQRIGSDALTDALTAAIAHYPDAQTLVDTYFDHVSDRDTLGITTLDMAKLTMLQSIATSDAQERLSQLSTQRIRLPILQMFSGSLLSGYTMTVPVRFSLLGSVHSNIETDIQSEGVNQVVHVVYLDLKVNVMVMTPLINVPKTVQTRAPIVYLVMSGPVPNAFYGAGDHAPFLSPSLPSLPTPSAPTRR